MKIQQVKIQLFFAAILFSLFTLCLPDVGGRLATAVLPDGMLRMLCTPYNFSYGKREGSRP